MAVLFLSHASRDDAEASALEAWLAANGFGDVFVDHHSIAGGDRWREALRASAAACRVVLCLVTESWLASHECFNEFRAAWYMGKRIIPLFLLPPGAAPGGEAGRRLAEIRAEDQGLDLTACRLAGGGLDPGRDREAAARLTAGMRAAGAIAKVGLDPEAFAVDRALRPMPFPGLASFGDEDADAALFYGRSREIAETLEELRKVRAERDLRPFVILGASGAGKSSLLKAGVIPRLRRETPAWLPLRAFRPGADPLLNFAEAIARTLADFGRVEAHGRIRDRLLAAWSGAERGADGRLAASGSAALEATLQVEGQALRAAAGRPAATILISVDQAEELARADDRSGEALADCLRVALRAAAASWQLAFTIRTDSFPELQRHRRFQDLEARGYDLRALPGFRFDSVVEAPARRYGVVVDDRLVDALMEDAPKEDALPLLAFALQRLWRQYAASGSLTKENYDSVGRLNGLIEDAAERALRGLDPDRDVPLPAAPPAQRIVDLGVATFVPALVQINDQGATIRRIAPWSGFDDEQQALLQRFDDWRLVVRKGAEAGGGTVEVAHEALFREWTRLKGWLEPERARLDALRALQVDAASWDRNGREPAFLTHRDARLTAAGALEANDRYRPRLGDLELDYLAACGKAEAATRRRTRRLRLAAAGLGAALLAGLIGYWEEAWLRGQWRRFMIERPYMLTQIRPHVLDEARERALPAGEVFKECPRESKDCPEMVVVPAGRFWMGAAKDDKDGNPWERPSHEVVLPTRFAVSRFEVTFAQWDACVAHGSCKGPPGAANDSWGRGDQPAINVSWHDAQDYVRWFSRMTGRDYRLLSEAEWEYAARAFSTAAYAHGDDSASLGDYAWYSENSESQAHPVGQKKPNAFGLFDMHGNVWEWVVDTWHDNYHDAPDDGSVWSEGGTRLGVIRGGAWRHDRQDLRAAARFRLQPRYRSLVVGFRVARTLLPPAP